MSAGTSLLGKTEMKGCGLQGNLASKVIHYRHLEGGELGVVKNNIHTPLNSEGFGRTLWCWREAAGMWSLQNAAQVILCHTGLYYISLLKDISFTLD